MVSQHCLLPQCWALSSPLVCRLLPSLLVLLSVACATSPKRLPSPARASSVLLNKSVLVAIRGPAGQIGHQAARVATILNTLQTTILTVPRTLGAMAPQEATATILAHILAHTPKYQPSARLQCRKQMCAGLLGPRLTS